MVVSDSVTAFNFRVEVIAEIDRRISTNQRIRARLVKKTNQDRVESATAELEDLRFFLNHIRFSPAAKPGINLGLAEAATIPAAKPGINLGLAEAATILAALRFYQEKGHTAPAEIYDISTAGGTLVSLDIEAIDRLCQTINLT